ncbi:hypothetical protein JOC94_001005 [Bacillus thermophilus]|uniref:Uncharacterized protein n=1 Tax=Siminovitchia thermophila TaxID=1245522 RepID=A0ABS2R316_9BACI|nr:hypothetical protein [Siminovitchia thermophila]
MKALFKFFSLNEISLGIIKYKWGNTVTKKP